MLGQFTHTSTNLVNPKVMDRVSPLTTFIRLKRIVIENLMDSKINDRVSPLMTFIRLKRVITMNFLALKLRSGKSLITLMRLERIIIGKQTQELNYPSRFTFRVIVYVVVKPGKNCKMVICHCSIC